MDPSQHLFQEASLDSIGGVPAPDDTMTSSVRTTLPGVLEHCFLGWLPELRKLLADRGCLFCLCVTAAYHSTQHAVRLKKYAYWLLSLWKSCPM